MGGNKWTLAGELLLNRRAQGGRGGGGFEVLPRGERSSNFLAIKDRFVCQFREETRVCIHNWQIGIKKNQHNVLLNTS